MLLIRMSSYGLRLRFALILALVLLAPGFAVPAAAQTTEQESEQEGESGETDQSGEVLNEGDNSNQCVAVQPVSNTGDAITDVDIVIQLPTGQDVKRFDINDVIDLVDELDLDLEDIGSTIELDPEQAVECEQAVDQAASAANEEAANEETGYCTWYWYPGWWCYWSTDGSWWYYGYQGNYTAYDAAQYWDSYYLWWTDGYYWYYDGLDYYSTVSNVAEGALNGTGSLATLEVLATLGLPATGLVIRRNRSGGSKD